MTPERAEAIAHVIADSLATGVASSIGVSWAEAIAEGLLLACAEQREIDAKIAENTVCDTHIPTGINIYGQVAARAIRGGA